MNKKNIRVIILAMAIFAAFFSGKKQERPERDKVEEIIAKMSLREKVGQLFIIEYSDKYDLEDPYFDKLI
ncbi:MAG TPA: hypothetical protein PLI69_06410, partial [Bacteroidales bacterium]|nr:hypothetical protein [Bacteroidales bacterium]